jgi:hypothetical protein
MTNKEKTNYTRIGLGLVGVAVDSMTAEVVWRTIEGIQQKKGKFAISDAVDIKCLVEKTYKPQSFDLPNLTIGGRYVELTEEQKDKLGEAVKRHGKDSVEVSVLLMDFAFQSRTEQKKGVVKQVNKNKNENKKIKV